MVDTQNGKQTKGPLYLILGISVAFVAAVIPFFPSSFRRNISNSLPFMPTTNAKKKQVIELLLSSKNSIKTGQKMVDLGSGDGRLVLNCAAHPTLFSKCIGVEMNRTLYLLSRAKLLFQSSLVKNRVSFVQGDMWKYDLRKVDGVFIFGIPALMKDLRNKCEKELPNGSWIITNKFGLPDRTPISTKGELKMYIKDSNDTK